MMKRGRQSEAERSVIPLCPGIQVEMRPPADTPAHIIKIFRSVIDNAPPGHFVQSDFPLIMAFCNAAHLSQQLAKQAMRKPSVVPHWARVTRTMTALATKLRLTPHSRTRPEGTARRMRDHTPSAYEMQNNDDED